MPILLSDLRTSVQTYLSTKVTISISAIAPDVPATLNPGEEGTFSVSVVNASAVAGGIRLTNVRYHLASSNAALLRLKVPAAAIATARSGAASSSPILAPGTLVADMYLFPADNSLDISDTDTIAGLKVKAAALGSTSVTCHIHADPDLDYLFPKDEASSIANRAVVIL